MELTTFSKTTFAKILKWSENGQKIVKKWSKNGQILYKLGQKVDKKWSKNGEKWY